MSRPGPSVPRPATRQSSAPDGSNPEQGPGGGICQLSLHPCGCHGGGDLEEDDEDDLEEDDLAIFPSVSGGSQGRGVHGQVPKDALPSETGLHHGQVVILGIHVEAFYSLELFSSRPTLRKARGQGQVCSRDSSRCFHLQKFFCLHIYITFH